MFASRVQSNNIDFATMPYRIVFCGQHTFIDIPSNSGRSQQINIPEQPDTNYLVIISHQASSQAYSFVMPAVSSKYTTYFNLYAWNNHTGVASATLGYVVIRLS